MGAPMAGVTDRDDVRQDVGPALGDRHDVMNLEPAAGAAANAPSAVPL